MRLKHVDYYLGLVESGELKLRGIEPGGTAWLERMEAEHANIRSVLGNESARPELRLRLAAAFYWLWYIHGHHQEGRRWLRDLLSRDRASPPPVRAKAMHGLGLLALQEADFDEADTRVRESLAQFESVQDKHGIALSYGTLGMVAHAQADMPMRSRYWNGGWVCA
jgi:non-specific serine/threonine protein kinase